MSVHQAPSVWPGIGYPTLLVAPPATLWTESQRRPYRKNATPRIGRAHGNSSRTGVPAPSQLAAKRPATRGADADRFCGVEGLPLEQLHAVCGCCDDRVVEVQAAGDRMAGAGEQ